LNRAGEARKSNQRLGHESVYISGKEDASKRRAFEYPRLSIKAAWSVHMFAVKARAAGTHGIDDIRLLATSLGEIQPIEALRICAEF
jgi:hypothetical protein